MPSPDVDDQTPRRRHGLGSLLAEIGAGVGGVNLEIDRRRVEAEALDLSWSPARSDE